MAETGPTTPRERYRTLVRAEIKERAWEQIASAGATALSLNAIAKQMGMSGPALYRYFDGRDELITELIRDAYQSLADTFRASAAAGADLAALAQALRGWALDDPHRYFLVYGTPIPGYHAPDDITGIASDIMRTLLDAVAALPPAVTAAPPADPAAPFAAYLESHHAWSDGHPVAPPGLHRALTFWTRLHGVLSLELAGHFAGMAFDPAVLFGAEVADLLAP